MSSSLRIFPTNFCATVYWFSSIYDWVYMLAVGEICPCMAAFPWVFQNDQETHTRKTRCNIVRHWSSQSSQFSLLKYYTDIFESWRERPRLSSSQENEYQRLELALINVGLTRKFWFVGLQSWIITSSQFWLEKNGTTLIPRTETFLFILYIYIYILNQGPKLKHWLRDTCVILC